MCTAVRLTASPYPISFSPPPTNHAGEALNTTDDDLEAASATGGVQGLIGVFQVPAEPATSAANKSSKGPGEKGGKKKNRKKGSSGRGNPEELRDRADTGGMISNPLFANRGLAAQVPGTAGGRPSASAVRTLRTCKYRSDNGRECNTKVDGGRAQLHCRIHTCPHAGCMSPKRSKASHCAAHTANGVDAAVGGRAGRRAFAPSSVPLARRASTYDGFDAVDDSAA